MIHEDLYWHTYQAGVSPDELSKCHAVFYSLKAYEANRDCFIFDLDMVAMALVSGFDGA